MSVLELIEYCQNHTSLELKTSDMSKKEKNILSNQKEIQKKLKDSSSGKDIDKKQKNQKKQEDRKQDREKPKAEEKDQEKKNKRISRTKRLKK